MEGKLLHTLEAGGIIVVYLGHTEHQETAAVHPSWGKSQTESPEFTSDNPGTSGGAITSYNRSVVPTGERRKVMKTPSDWSELVELRQRRKKQYASRKKYNYIFKGYFINCEPHGCFSTPHPLRASDSARCTATL